jgi:glycosyltransferase involved in cell wall biosynthesis
MSDSVRIVARTNRVGIDRDVRIVSEALSSWGPPPTFSHYRSISPLRRFFGRPPAGSALVFLERITARWLRSAERFVLIPNQERYPRRLVPLLRHVDHVFCKSRHAAEIFAQHHDSVHFLGFTSIDRRLADVEPDYDRFFHLGGGSALKQTHLLVDLWRRHPEWPTLTVVWHRAGTDLGAIPPNVVLIQDYLADDDLRRLQNACGVHLCPSLSEGWGHYIVEAMSCGAVTVVTDGPPMNELVAPDRGVLVPVERSEPRKLGFDFHVDPVELERAVASLVVTREEAKQQWGRAARRWYEDNGRRFGERLRALWTGLM